MGGHVWQWGVHGRGMHVGACMGSMCDRGCAWQGGMHGRGSCVVGRCAWQGVRGGGCVWRGGVGDTATAANGTHSTGMHSCSG